MLVVRMSKSSNNKINNYKNKFKRNSNPNQRTLLGIIMSSKRTKAKDAKNSRNKKMNKNDKNIYWLMTLHSFDLIIGCPINLHRNSTSYIRRHC